MSRQSTPWTKGAVESSDETRDPELVVGEAAFWLGAGTMGWVIGGGIGRAPIAGGAPLPGNAPTPEGAPAPNPGGPPIAGGAPTPGCAPTPGGAPAPGAPNAPGA